MTKILSATLWLLFFLCFALPLQAATMHKKDGALWVYDITTSQLEDLFAQYNYNEFNKIRLKVPRIYLQHLPSDWAKIPESHDKNRLFIKILLPLVLKINEDINTEKFALANVWKNYLTNGKLSKADTLFLEQKAQKYDVFTPSKSANRPQVLLEGLQENVDALPPSIIIAAAGIYSDWGTSRLALQANSLYREEIWYSSEGIDPLGEKNANYKYKTFDNLEQSIASYMLKINSHINFYSIRKARNASRKMNKLLYGQQVVAQMLFDSNLKNIAGLINYTLSYYQLHKTDYYPQLEDIK